ncbi:MAG: hypothetical protein SFX72_13835 [Isosphaeraceae bacterium]|nr:hypothetical protein [Isosphaeraceae bacterium]
MVKWDKLLMLRLGAAAANDAVDELVRLSMESGRDGFSKDDSEWRERVASHVGYLHSSVASFNATAPNASVTTAALDSVVKVSEEVEFNGIHARSWHRLAVKRAAAVWSWLEELIPDLRRGLSSPFNSLASSIGFTLPNRCRSDDATPIDHAFILARIDSIADAIIRLRPRLEELGILGTDRLLENLNHEGLLARERYAAPLTGLNPPSAEAKPEAHREQPGDSIAAEAVVDGGSAEATLEELEASALGVLKRKPKQRRLVDFMRGKRSASQADVAEALYGEVTAEGDNVAKTARRSSESLQQAGIPLDYKSICEIIYKERVVHRANDR